MKGDSLKKITLLPDGTKHSANKLAKMFGVNQATISRHYAKGKTSWTRAELEAWSNNLMSGPPFFRKIKTPEEYSGPPRNIHDVQYRPSAIESSLLAL